MIKVLNTTELGILESRMKRKLLLAIFQLSEWFYISEKYVQRSTPMFLPLYYSGVVRSKTPKIRILSQSSFINDTHRKKNLKESIIQQKNL